MATVSSQPRAPLVPGAEPVGAEPPRSEAHRRVPPWGLGVGVAVALAYAAFAGGATDVPAAAKLQVLVAVLALGAIAGLLFGVLRLAAPGLAYAGLAALAGYALWSAYSLDWTISKELTWTELNQAISYALFAAVALVLGGSLRRGARDVALGYVGLVAVVCLYALGGKALPWLNVPGLFDLNQGELSRLNAPFGYWNALGLFCLLAAPLALRAATDRLLPRNLRLGSLASLVLVIVTISLTYSRGGIIVLALIFVAMLALGPERPRLALYLGAALAGSVSPLITAFVRSDLTTDRLSVASRTDDGLLFLLALVLGVAAAVVAGTVILDRGDRVHLSKRGQALVRRWLVAALVLVVVGGLGALALSNRGVGGTISHEISSFKKTKADKTNEPNRLLQTNSGNRWTWWNEAAGAWSDRKLGGNGAGTFPRLHLLYRQNTLEVKQAHSVPLQLGAETGVMGAGLALGGLALLWLAGFTRLRELDASERGYAVAMLIAAAAWGVHMWFDWDWNIPGVTLPLLLLLGVAAGLPKARRAEAGERRRGSRRSRPAIAVRVVAVGVAGVALAWMAVHAVRPWNAQDETDAALSQAASGKKGDLAAAARKADDAAGADPNAVEPLYAAASIAERRQRYRAEGRYLDRLAQRDPDSAQTWLRIARFDLLINDRPGALQALRRFLALDPHANFASYSGFISDFGSFLGDSAAASATATGTPLPKAVKVQPAAPPPAAPSGGATPGTGGTGSPGAGAGGGAGTGAAPGSGQ